MAQKEESTRKEKEKVIVKYEEELRAKEKEVAEKYDEGMKTARDQLAMAARRVNEATAKLYRQLVWIFGIGVLGSGIAGGILFYTGNPRMGIYAFASSAFFATGAFLTIWLQENQWVVWLFLLLGVGTIIAAWILKHGWRVREAQLTAMAGKRALLERIMTANNITFVECGLKAGDSLANLELHELECVQDRLVEILKARKLNVPDVLKD